MNNTQKILVAVALGVGVAYIYKRYKKPKTGINDSTKGALISADPSATPNTQLSREEKEEFILDNVSATPQEMTSGFEGVHFVWNPNIEKMYPVGTITVGQEPTFGEIFNSADGESTSNKRLANPNLTSVAIAESSLKSLNDEELELLYRVTKTMSENPSIKSDEDALSQLGITNPNIIKVFTQKLKKRLNDIKIMKKDSSWGSEWKSRKEKRKNRRKEFSDKMGFDKDSFDKEIRKSCGQKPRGIMGQAKYKKCVQSVANKMRSQIKAEVREELSSAPVSVKEDFNIARQESFKDQVTNRVDGGMFAGKRWDGESNKQVESMVDARLV
jgi:hypothetical protein